MRPVRRFPRETLRFLQRGQRHIRRFMVALVAADGLPDGGLVSRHVQDIVGNLERQPESLGIGRQSRKLRFVRPAEDGATIRRRRECNGCGKRFTTYEVVEKLPLMVVKQDGRREVFKRDKILNGVVRSCDKRDISMERIVALVNEIERDVRNTMEQEVPSSKIGELVMNRLKDFDEVAYIRFASVYRKFADISSFLEELKVLQAHKGEEAKDK